MKNMEVRQALSHITEIRQALLGTQLYRGHRPATIAATGLLAVVASSFLDRSPLSFAASWFLIGVFCFLLVGGEMAYDYNYCFGLTQKRLARTVLGQFLPPLAVGAGVTALWAPSTELSTELLPALWSCFYGLGLFAARLHLGRGIGWVALFFTVSGLSLLTSFGQTVGFSAMGWVFGFGQLALAAVLHRNLPRGGDRDPQN